MRQGEDNIAALGNGLFPLLLRIKSVIKWPRHLAGEGAGHYTQQLIFIAFFIWCISRVTNPITI